MPSNADTKIYPCICIDLSIPKAGEVTGKEELKTMLKWGNDVIFEREMLTHLKKFNFNSQQQKVQVFSFQQ